MGSARGLGMATPVQHETAQGQEKSSFTHFDIAAACAALTRSLERLAREAAQLAALCRERQAEEPQFIVARATLVDDIEHDILRCHGPVLRSRDLARLLGYTPAAFRIAARRGTLPIATSPGRRGHQATARDVALWLAGVRERALREMEDHEQAVGKWVITVPDR